MTPILKIYIPDTVKIELRKKVVPPLYPLLNDANKIITDTDQYGNWVNQVSVVNEPAQAHIMLPAYYIEYYRNNDLLKQLKYYHKQALDAKAIPVYFSSGDFTLSPPLNAFHLFVHGDYRSAAHANYSLYPNFFPDPNVKFYNGKMSYHYTKTDLPVCGFCGQAYAGIEKKYFDYARILKQKIRKIVNPWNDDAPPFLSAAYKRAKILDALKKSQLLSCNFIIEKKYRAGVNSKEDKQSTSERYFENMQKSLYIICYRGTGNFSVRLYETMAAGRIPVILRSDDVLPFEDKIDWSVFPIVPEQMIYKADKIIASFHAAHSAESLLRLQQHARNLYENYFAYKGFMDVFVNKYLDEAKR